MSIVYHRSLLLPLFRFALSNLAKRCCTIYPIAESAFSAISTSIAVTVAKRCYTPSSQATQWLIDQIIRELLSFVINS